MEELEPEIMSMQAGMRVTIPADECIFCQDKRLAVEMAVSAERERCAKIAESFSLKGDWDAQVISGYSAFPISPIRAAIAVTMRQIVAAIREQP